MEHEPSEINQIESTMTGSGQNLLVALNNGSQELELSDSEASADGLASTSARNLIAFWIIGVCNNFGYVVMLSAAKDILEGNIGNVTTGGCANNTKEIKCSFIATGAVLLADILPSLCIKILSLFLFLSISYSVRHTLVVVLQLSSFLIVAFSERVEISLLGVVFASLGAGLGEVTYLSLCSHFNRNLEK